MAFDIGQGKYENVYNPSTGTYQLVKVSGQGPAIIGSSESGTYTSPTGQQQTRQQAMAQGTIDKPGVASAKMATAGVGAPQVTTQRPIGLEALKQAELQAARQETARKQSEQATTPGEARSIQSMLKSPTAQFASQEVAQRGYELAARYDRSFVPEQVRATLAPQQQVQQAQEQVKQRFFYPAPREQVGIKPSVSITPQPGSIAERAAFERRREGFYTYGTVRRLEGISSRLQERFESAIGYNERSSLPVKAAAGFGSAFTGIPAFAGQVAGAGEAIIRYPSASLRGIPTGFKILSSQISEQARTKPIEFGGSLVGMAAISRLPARISIPKVSEIKSFSASETASLGRSSDVWSKIPTMRQTAESLGKPLTRKIDIGRTFKEPSGQGVAVASGKQQLIAIQEQKFVNPLRGGVETTYSPSRAIRETKYVRAEQRSVAATSMGHKAQMSMVSKLKSRTESIQTQLTKQVRQQETGQRIKVPIIPYALQIPKQISKQSQVSTQIQKQRVSQEYRQKPIIIQRSKQVYANLPMSIQSQTQVMKSLQVQKPIQIQKQAQTQRIEPLRVQKMPESQLQRFEQRKKTEYPKSTETISPLFKKKRKSKTKTRRFITALGGKTIKQIQADIKRKHKRII